MGFDLKFLKDHCPPDFDTFIETGSHYGDTISRALLKFREIHSIELCQSYHDGCKARFEDFQKKVNLYLGDSAEVMKEVVEKTKDQKCFVFLDAHYSCESDETLKERGSVEMLDHHQCPAEAELEALKGLSHSPIIIVDNIQMFEFSSKMNKEHLQRLKRDEWPEVDALKAKIKEIDPSYVITKVPNLRLLQDAGALPPNNEEQMVGDLLVALPGGVAQDWGIPTEVKEGTFVHFLVTIADKKTGNILYDGAPDPYKYYGFSLQEPFDPHFMPPFLYKMLKGLKVGDKRTQEFFKDKDSEENFFRDYDTVVTVEVVYVEPR